MQNDHEIHERRKGRNFSLGLILGGFVLLVFVVTVVKLAQNENFIGTARIPAVTPTLVSE